MGHYTRAQAANSIMTPSKGQTHIIYLFVSHEDMTQAISHSSALNCTCLLQPDLCFYQSPCPGTWLQYSIPSATLQVFNTLFSFSNDFLYYFLNNYLLSSEIVVYTVFQETSLWLLQLSISDSNVTAHYQVDQGIYLARKRFCHFLCPVLLPARCPSDMPAHHGAAGSNEGWLPVAQPKQKATANIQQQFPKPRPELTPDQ